MDGPEHLDAGAPHGRGRTWVVVLVLVAVVVGLGAVRFTGLVPGPNPMPTPTVSTGPTVDPAATAWPRDVGQGTLYAIDERGLVVIDVGSGLVQRADVDLGGVPVMLTAFYTGVVEWPEVGRGKPRLVTATSPDSFPTAGLVARGRQFLPGPDGTVWVTPTDASAPTQRSTWRLVDGDQVRSRSEVELRGTVVGDGSGGLFAVEDSHVRHVAPGRPTSGWTGDVLAVGPDGYEAVACSGQRCRIALHDRSTGQETPVARPTPADLALGALSPGNRYVASVEQTSLDDDSSTVVRVSAPGSEKELRSFAASHDQEVLTWVSDRWLVAGGPDGMVLYDAVADRVVTPAIGLSAPSALVFQPA